MNVCSSTCTVILFLVNLPEVDTPCPISTQWLNMHQKTQAVNYTVFRFRVNWPRMIRSSIPTQQGRSPQQYSYFRPCKLLRNSSADFIIDASCASLPWRKYHTNTERSTSTEKQAPYCYSLKVSKYFAVKVYHFKKSSVLFSKSSTTIPTLH